MGDQNRAKDHIDNSMFTERLYRLDPAWQKRLADEGIATVQATIRWRNNSGEPKLDTVKRIAALYGCKTGYLLGDNEDQESGFEALLKYFQLLDESCSISFSFRQETKDDFFDTMTVAAEYGNREFTAIREYLESVRAIKALPLEETTKAALIETVRHKLAQPAPDPEV